MLATRQNKISEIVDEVDELHPVLLRLLRKLPTIVELEYTHGNREMGADFVLARHHEVFGTTEYIGVIAKVGRILQNYSDVKRQIDECKVPRNFNGGNKKIRINEVWVIATENISENAQDKIHEEFALYNVQFIDGIKLSELVDKYMPSYWLEMAAEISEYLTSLRASNSELDRKLSLIKAEGPSIYIHQDIKKKQKKEYGNRQPKPQKTNKINIKHEIETNSVIWIEGGMGAGKSKLLRQLVDDYCSPSTFTETKTFPIPISFKDLVERYDCNVESIVDTITTKCGIGQDIRDSSKYLILIDAVDEKDIPLDDQISYLQKIVAAVKETNKIRCVITSRALRGFDSDHQLFRGIAAYEMADLSVIGLTHDAAST